MMNPQDMAEFMEFYQAFKLFQQMNQPDPNPIAQAQPNSMSISSETFAGMPSNNELATLQAQIKELQTKLTEANQQLAAARREIESVKSSLSKDTQDLLNKTNPSTGSNFTLAEAVKIEFLNIKDSFNDQEKAAAVRASFDNDIPENMRKWAVIKKYNELVDEGIIKPKYQAVEDYNETYSYMVNNLTTDEMEEIIKEAEEQTQRRRERLAQNQFEAPTVDFSDVTEMMGWG